jgi:hypothetical protein
MSECLVICGKLSANAAAAKDVIALDVDAPEHAPNRVNLTLGDISSCMVQDVPPVLVDLLERRWPRRAGRPVNLGGGCDRQDCRQDRCWRRGCRSCRSEASSRSRAA